MDAIVTHVINYLNHQILTDKHGNALYYTSDIVHKDKDGDYQVYSRANDAIRYHGELLNLPIIEGAAVSSILLLNPSWSI